MSATPGACALSFAGEGNTLYALRGPPILRAAITQRASTRRRGTSLEIKGGGSVAATGGGKGTGAGGGAGIGGGEAVAGGNITISGRDGDPPKAEKTRRALAAGIKAAAA